MMTEPENHIEDPTIDVDAAEAALDERDLQILELENQVAAMRDEMLREKADLVNSRNRLAKDMEQARKFANEKLLADLLPVIDAVEAGLATTADSDAGVRSGLELTLKELIRVAGNHGLVEVNPSGEAFNPEHHQAIQTIDTDAVAPGHVANVFQKGWLLNGRLIRPALVVVRNQ